VEGCAASVGSRGAALGQNIAPTAWHPRAAEAPPTGQVHDVPTVAWLQVVIELPWTVTRRGTLIRGFSSFSLDEDASWSLMALTKPTKS
jgi:hypothetical protein